MYVENTQAVMEDKQVNNVIYPNDEDKPSFFTKMKRAMNLASPPMVYDFDNPAPFVPPKFESSDNALADFFNANGYVVIKAVATPEQVEKGISLFWDLVEQQQPAINRNDPSTWKTETWVASAEIGIMSGYGIGQSEFLWYTRQLPKVKEAFTRVWETDDLLVSYDGCGVFRPIEYDSKWKTTSAWYHIDQNCYNRKGRHAVQGLVNFFPSGPHDGGFVVVPKSTFMIEEAFEKHADMCSKRSRDYVQIRKEDPFWMECIQRIERNESNKYDLFPVKLVLEPGELVLWDSRAIHCSCPPSVASRDPEAKNRLKRLAAYICMTPAALSTDIDQLLKYRIFGFQRGVTTTHWPHEFQPSWVGKDKHPGVGADVVKLTPEQAKLITGTTHIFDVYDESLVANVNLEDLLK